MKKIRISLGRTNQVIHPSKLLGRRASRRRTRTEVKNKLKDLLANMSGPARRAIVFRMQFEAQERCPSCYLNGEIVPMNFRGNFWQCPQCFYTIDNIKLASHGGTVRSVG